MVKRLTLVVISLQIVLFQFPTSTHALGFVRSSILLLNSAKSCYEYNKNYTFQLNVNPHRVNHTFQTYDVDYYANRPLGELPSALTVEVKAGDQYMTIYNSTAENCCYKAYQYLGQGLKEIQNKMGMPTGCPMPAGRYRGKGFHLNFGKMSFLQAIPTGILKGTWNVFLDRKRKILGGCHIFEFENMAVE